MNNILEHMALEKAIVQFDLVEGRRSAGDAAVYARPNEAGDLAAKIVALLDDPQRRARMGAEGRRRLEERLEWRHQLRACWMRIAERCQSDIGRFEDATGHRL
jgi:glycosyltransferase involved in cell wall biosynthesis